MFYKVFSNGSQYEKIYWIPIRICEGHFEILMLEDIQQFYGLPPNSLQDLLTTELIELGKNISQLNIKGQSFIPAEVNYEKFVRRYMNSEIGSLKAFIDSCERSGLTKIEYGNPALKYDREAMIRCCELCENFKNYIDEPV